MQRHIYYLCKTEDNDMKRMNRRIWVLAALFLSLTACDPTKPVDPEPEKSDKAALLRLGFNTSDNPGMTTSSSGTTANGYYCISVPEGVDRAKLVPDLKISDGATASIDGKDYVAGQAYDFSGNIQTLKIVSESGNKAVNYSILVKHGNPYIDNKVYQFMNDFSVPGVSLSIMKGTKVVYSTGYGFANTVAQTRVTPDHLFRMASISKQFCTMCIMTLKEQGKLRLDDKVFGPGGILDGKFTNLTSFHESMTVRHLLSHCSGICNGLGDPAFTNSYRFYSDGTTPVPSDTLIQRTINARQSPYTSGSTTYYPGAAYSYSNVGFVVLHRIVEVLSGKDYEKFLKEDVLSKMGITDTHIGGYQNERRDNECIFYSQGGGDGYKNPLRELAGAAGIITSTNQMMKILTYMDGDDSVPDIFTPETLADMYTPTKYDASTYNRYGLGWRMNHSYLFPGSHYHGGNIAGTATLWVGNTNQHMSGAFVCNSRAYNSNSTGDIDDNLYVLLDEFLKYFNN